MEFIDSNLTQTFRWNEILEEILDIQNITKTIHDKLAIQLKFIESNSTNTNRDLMLHKLFQLSLCRNFEIGYLSDLIHLQVKTQEDTIAFETIFSQLEDFIFISKIVFEGCGLFGNTLSKISDSPFAQFLPNLEAEARKKGFNRIILNSHSTSDHLYYFTQGFTALKDTSLDINSELSSNAILIKEL